MSCKANANNLLILKNRVAVPYVHKAYLAYQVQHTRALIVSQPGVRLSSFRFVVLQGTGTRRKVGSHGSEGVEKTSEQSPAAAAAAAAPPRRGGGYNEMSPGYDEGVFVRCPRRIERPDDDVYCVGVSEKRWTGG